MDGYLIDPSAVPAEITKRQFFQQLAVVGIIAPEDALAAVKVGTIPAPLQAFIDAIGDADAQFAAEMVISGGLSFLRAHPLTIAIGASQGMTSAQIDDFFRAAAAL